MLHSHRVRLSVDTEQQSKNTPLIHIRPDKPPARESTMQLPRLTSLAFALYFSLLVAGNRAQLSPKGSRLAESLGLLLGLPLDLDMRSDSSNTAPSFLMKIYNCWSALGSSEDRSQCLTDVPESTPRGVLEDVNVVRSIRGTG